MPDPKAPAPPAAHFFNYMTISHTKREFFFGMAQAAETPGMASLVARVVTTPGHAKAVLKALRLNVEKYERQYGTIEEDGAGEQTSKERVN